MGSDGLAEGLTPQRGLARAGHIWRVRAAGPVPGRRQYWRLMHITVDYDLCEGHGQCILAAPESSTSPTAPNKWWCSSRTRPKPTENVWFGPPRCVPRKRSESSTESFGFGNIIEQPVAPGQRGGGNAVADPEFVQ